MSKTAALELKNISKSFGSVVANKNVDLTLYKGEILALLGENGSGKTTLMNMIAGIYYPDEGQIFVDGKEAVISSPKDAFGYGIGMIHQHFKLVDVFSASENIILGVKDGRKFNIKNVNATVGEICRKYGFNIDPKKKIYEMSVSEKQTVEIIKVIYRGAEILILDEPTAVLTPQESGKLFDILRKMREDGKSIIIITHKLHEVLSISDRVAVLRRGEHIATVNTAETNEISRDFLLLRVRHKRVRAGNICKNNVCVFRFKFALCICDGFAGPVSRMLIHTGERVKYRAFSDVRIACKCDKQITGVFSFYGGV